MNCKVENYRSHEAPIPAGTFRFLFGLTLLFAGLYIATLSEVQGHGLGFLLAFASPFVALKNAH